MRSLTASVSVSRRSSTLRCNCKRCKGKSTCMCAATHSLPSVSVWRAHKHLAALQSRDFTTPNPAYGVEAKARKHLKFPLTCLFGAKGTKLAASSVTNVTAITGLPMTSASALRALCGKPGAAKKALKELDAANEQAQGADVVEALGDAVVEDSAPEEGDGSSAVATGAEAVADVNASGGKPGGQAPTAQCAPCRPCMFDSAACWLSGPCHVVGDQYI